MGYDYGQLQPGWPADPAPQLQKVPQLQSCSSSDGSAISTCRKSGATWILDQQAAAQGAAAAPEDCSGDSEASGARLPSISQPQASPTAGRKLRSRRDSPPPQSPAHSSSRLRKRRSSRTTGAPSVPAAAQHDDAAAAVADARDKAERAMRLIAIAQHLARQEAAAAAPPKRRAGRRAEEAAGDASDHGDDCETSGQRRDSGSGADWQSPRRKSTRRALHALVGARIAVLRSTSGALHSFCKAEVMDVDGRAGRCRVQYDSGTGEWLPLAEQDFRWLAPRATSAGCSLSMKAAMVQAKALNVADGFQQPLAGFPRPPAGSAAVGGRVAIHFAGDGRQYCGWVLAWDEDTERHHVLYEDGEDEWMDLATDALEWLPADRCGVLHGGLPPGSQPPRNEDAVGWQLGVYWAADAAFYRANVADFDSDSGEHSLLYDDGERESLCLHEEAIKWLQPPQMKQSVAWQPPQPIDIPGGGMRGWMPADASPQLQPWQCQQQQQQQQLPVSFRRPPSLRQALHGGRNMSQGSHSMQRQQFVHFAADCRPASPALLMDMPTAGCRPHTGRSSLQPRMYGSLPNATALQSPCNQAAAGAASGQIHLFSPLSPQPPHLRRSVSAAAAFRSSLPNVAGGTAAQDSCSPPDMALAVQPPAELQPADLCTGLEPMDSGFCDGICNILCDDDMAGGVAMDAALNDSPASELLSADCAMLPASLPVSMPTYSMCAPPLLQFSQPTPGLLEAALAPSALPPPRSISMPSLHTLQSDSGSCGGGCGGFGFVPSEHPFGDGCELEPELEGMLQAFVSV